MEKKLVRNGINNLKEFGYPHVNESNIFTDIVYSQFFLSMLRETKIEGGTNQDIVNACDSLIAKINSVTEPTNAKPQAKQKKAKKVKMYEDDGE
jgi:hypothetical protein